MPSRSLLCFRLVRQRYAAWPLGCCSWCRFCADADALSILAATAADRRLLDQGGNWYRRLLANPQGGMAGRAERGEGKTAPATAGELTLVADLFRRKDAKD